MMPVRQTLSTSDIQLSYLEWSQGQERGFLRPDEHRQVRSVHWQGRSGVQLRGIFPRRP